MSGQLAGSSALVTGGGSGIGAAVAAGLADAGARVVVCDIVEDSAQRVASDIGGVGLVVDVRDTAAVARAVEHAGRLGPLRVLVNSAGVVGGFGPLLELPVDALRAAFDVNVVGTFLVTQAAGRAMAATGEGGAIVNISSAGAFQPTVGLGHYEATKAAINALTRSAAMELAAHDVRVNAIAPGPVDTPFTRGGLSNPGAREAWLSRIPLRRIADPEDLVPIVLLLASDAARHITGTVLAIDGGQLLT